MPEEESNLPLSPWGAMAVECQPEAANIYESSRTESMPIANVVDVAARPHRVQPRVPCTISAICRELSEYVGTYNGGTKAVVRNLSSGGMLVEVERALLLGSVLRCELQAPNLPASIPTMLQVRWIQPTQCDSYLCGLMYLV